MFTVTDATLVIIDDDGDTVGSWLEFKQINDALEPDEVAEIAESLRDTGKAWFGGGALAEFEIRIVE